MPLRQIQIRRNLLVLILAAACVSTAPGFAVEPRTAPKSQGPVTKGPYAIVYKRSKTVHAVYSYEAHTPNLTASFWELFAAKPPNLPSQFEVQSRLIPNGQEVSESSSLGR